MLYQYEFCGLFRSITASSQHSHLHYPGVGLAPLLHGSEIGRLGDLGQAWFLLSWIKTSAIFNDHHNEDDCVICVAILYEDLMKTDTPEQKTEVETIIIIHPHSSCGIFTASVRGFLQKDLLTLFCLLLVLSVLLVVLVVFSSFSFASSSSHHNYYYYN